MPFDHLNYSRRLELNAALEAGEAFVQHMKTGDLLAASRALTVARRSMDGDTVGCCQMCASGGAKYEVCDDCFFKAHKKDGGQ